MNRQNFVIFIVLTFFGFALIVNWYVLNRSDVQLSTIDQLKEHNARLTEAVREQQKTIKKYEERESTWAMTKPSSMQAVNRTLSEKEVRFNQILDDYYQLHNDITSGRKPPRYTHCVLLNGWGNVFQEAISCFILALATDRAAIFNTRAVDHYMPFKDFLSYTTLPIDLYNVDLINGLEEVLMSRYELTCLNFDDYADREVLTVHYTYDWYAPNLLTNPNHGEKLLDILPSNYFQLIFARVFPLREDMKRDVEKFKRDHFGPYTIGIQIRYPTHDSKGAKDHKGFPVPPPDLYAQAAEQLSRFQSEVPYEDVVWFIATQNEELIERLQGYYGKKKIVSYNGTITTTFEINTEGQKAALTTWWILGEADEVITTEASSYGTTAGARTGRFPIVCTHQKFCFRRLSQTPCQDTPFLPADQPQKCLEKERLLPHQFMTSPENSCGYFKYQIYTSPEFSSDEWKL